jgi:phosphoglycolate phosphatase-like HAD superfamily hydrolase
MAAVDRKAGPALPALVSKTVFVFDWDGTLIDSMAVKGGNFARAFAAAVKGAPDLGTLELQYRELSGRPRKEIFETVTARLGLGSPGYEDFNRAFTRENESTLAGAPVFEDALDLLGFLRGRGRTVFISSSVPQKELEGFVRRKLGALAEGLAGILGSSDGFAKGPGHIAFIEKKASCGKASILAVGDDAADHALSLAAGVDFVMIDRSRRFTGGPAASVPDLRVLKDMIAP